MFWSGDASDSGTAAEAVDSGVGDASAGGWPTAGSGCPGAEDDEVEVGLGAPGRMILLPMRTNDMVCYVRIGTGSLDLAWRSLSTGVVFN